MKTLEQAAHRVNTLLSEKIAENVKGLAADDQEVEGTFFYIIMEEK